MTYDHDSYDMGAAAADVYDTTLPRSANRAPA
jgi:hypothetical protein